ncbi:hypothetical protein FB567DRAFT_536822 [Paraphoma chrysanthemicola]|uniref:Uncharacterized protein n=1 Tax=Paraphoma chrysanthemicola TaxID=798071 RepID=A0A8K0VTH0_9PLEO|nr:hypothetical protein FB567DRAFT_536822 [Paraphoma chrysanthemicola]
MLILPLHLLNVSQAYCIWQLAQPLIAALRNWHRETSCVARFLVCQPRPGMPSLHPPLDPELLATLHLGGDVMVLIPALKIGIICGPTTCRSFKAEDGFQTQYLCVNETAHLLTEATSSCIQGACSGLRRVCLSANVSINKIVIKYLKLLVLRHKGQFTGIRNINFLDILNAVFFDSKSSITALGAWTPSLGTPDRGDNLAPSVRRTTIRFAIY